MAFNLYDEVEREARADYRNEADALRADARPDPSEYADLDEEENDWDQEPDLDAGFEFDSSMESIGWGDDDAWGASDMIGGDSDLMGEW